MKIWLAPKQRENYGSVCIPKKSTVSTVILVSKWDSWNQKIHLRDVSQLSMGRRRREGRKEFRESCRGEGRLSKATREKNQRKQFPDLQFSILTSVGKAGLETFWGERGSLIGGGDWKKGAGWLPAAGWITPPPKGLGGVRRQQSPGSELRGIREVMWGTPRTAPVCFTNASHGSRNAKMRGFGSPSGWTWATAADPCAKAYVLSKKMGRY